MWSGNTRTRTPPVASGDDLTAIAKLGASRKRLKAEIAKVTEATLVYVATDEQRKPRALPPLEG